jgi:hypothetical protein
MKKNGNRKSLRLVDDEKALAANFKQRLAEVNRRIAAEEAEARNWKSPHCLDCRSTNLSYKYADNASGTVVTERHALSMACMFIGEEIGAEDDPTRLAELARVQHELALMWAQRPGAGDEQDEEPNRKAVRS